ncbi:Bgt-1477 [Blumeria graminis f. sp. tritici]|uniref:Bgt-1477 n=2 Tax=Blumeria graminis f. sp. tritici TaxID=62690 RepID=A0A061HNK0_BLUGR|nr:hypothetical protein BGT96224_1477 [Blumeria graminis f. sp. tritici 96224]VDB83877.1 Bgt-1477 [Blumeria graminis f. sp. tritici]
MATKKSKASAPTDEELNQMLEGLEEDVAPALTKGIPAGSNSTTTPQAEQDILAELENLGTQIPSSRPHTPRVATSVKYATTSPSLSTRTSDDRAHAPRKSGDSLRSFHTGFTVLDARDEGLRSSSRTTVAQESKPSTGSGWWGSVFATASAAVKTAEAAVKEIKESEEAKRWAEQVKGNVGALQDLGGQISSRALPTFTNILHTLAPPISSHERLQIHITHDLIGYPPLDPLIYSTFSRVMAQVEGGDLLVIQRGHESSARRNSEIGIKGSSSGWNDGKWWSYTPEARDLCAVKGLVEGTKLVRVSAETYAEEYFNVNGGLEKATKRATEELSDSNPVRRSDIFFAVQAIIHYDCPDYFQASKKDQENDNISIENEGADELISFAIYLLDPVHGIKFHTVSQSLPAQWIKWLDASNPTQTIPSESFLERKDVKSLDNSNILPEEIAQIIEDGGIDPREWVAEWVEEILSLVTGVLAQRYIARRMGVGDNTIGKGRVQTEEVLKGGGGEAARATLI